MDHLWEKLAACVAAVFSFLGGLYLRDRAVIHERLTRVEADGAQSRIDIRVIEARFSELKEDTAEIKETQKMMLQILSGAHK